MERNVPKLRFKGFNDELKKEKFQNLVTLQRGSSPRPIIKYITTSEDGVNWIKIGDVSTGKTFIDKTAEKITKEGAEKSRKVQVGDLILSNSMSFGRPYIMKIDGYIHDGWFVLKNYQKNFNREYLCQLLTSPIIQKQYKRLAAGGVVNNISSELVNAVIVNVPSLQEQERIANFLTKVDKIIEKQDEKVKNLEKYKKGMMQKIFSQEIRFKDEKGNEYPEWEEKKLNEILVAGSKERVKNIKDYQKITIKLNLKGIEKSLASREMADTRPFYVREEGEIIIGKQNYFNGSIAIVDKEYSGCICSNAIMSFKVKNENNYYVYNYISQKNYLKKKELFANGTGQKELSEKDFLNFEIHIPVKEEQNRIANFILKFDKIVNSENKKLEQLKQWKKGLLQQMFV